MSSNRWTDDDTTTDGTTTDGTTTDDTVTRAWSNVPPERSHPDQPFDQPFQDPRWQDSHFQDPQFQNPPTAQYDPATPVAQSSSTSPFLVAAIAVVATLIVVAIGFFIAMYYGFFSEPEPLPEDNSAGTVTTEVQQDPGAETQQDSATRSYGDGLEVFKTCEASGVSWVGTGTSSTSCPFATNVGIALAGVEPGKGEKIGTVYSPTTDKNYRMKCSISHDRNDQEFWRCTGGRNAVVFVYR